MSYGQQALEQLGDIYIQWQQIRRQLLVLDPDVFGRSIDDIEDQLDLMSLGNFVYCQPVDLWQEYPRYLKALLLRLDRLPNNLQRDHAAIDDVDPWMDKVFKFKMIQESKIVFDAGRITDFFIFSADENQDAYFANSTTKVMGSFGNQLK